MSENTVVIVSGIMRSGTAMMMQMLEKGGCPVHVSLPMRADNNNARGYYDHTGRRALKHSSKLITDAVGRAVKVFAGQLEFLPDTHNYEVILMERNLNELWTSRMKIATNRPKAKDGFFAIVQREGLLQIIETAKLWAENNDHVKMISVNYMDVINSPLDQAKRINDFLTTDLDVREMMEAVDPKLYSVRGETKYLVTDRAPFNISELIKTYTKDKVYCEIGIGEGHILSKIDNAKEVIGIEKEEYGVERCKHYYPDLNVLHGDMFKLLPDMQFDVCYMWLIYPDCKRVVDLLLEKNPDTVIIMGLTYFFHLPEGDSKRNKYIMAYPEKAKADLWNRRIERHLEELKEKNIPYTMKEVIADNDETFSVCIING